MHKHQGITAGTLSSRLSAGSGSFISIDVDIRGPLGKGRTEQPGAPRNNQRSGCGDHGYRVTAIEGTREKTLPQDGNNPHGASS